MEIEKIYNDWVIENKKQFDSSMNPFEMFKAGYNQALQLQQTGVSGSALPVGFKIYECTDCKEINIKKDNREITVGFCDNCDHPLWNDDVN